MSGATKPPARPSDVGDGAASDKIAEHVHYYANDLDGLRRLAEVNPDLANKVVDQRDSENAREHFSYRFGVGVTLILAIAILGSAVYCLAHVGLVHTFLMITSVVATAFLVRVILTGEWSDTSWFGSLVTAVAKMLGAKVDDEPPKGA